MFQLVDVYCPVYALGFRLLRLSFERVRLLSESTDPLLARPSRFSGHEGSPPAPPRQRKRGQVGGGERPTTGFEPRPALGCSLTQRLFARNSRRAYVHRQTRVFRCANLTCRRAGNNFLHRAPAELSHGQPAPRGGHGTEPHDQHFQACQGFRAFHPYNIFFLKKQNFLRLKKLGNLGSLGRWQPVSSRISLLYSQAFPISMASLMLKK